MNNEPLGQQLVRLAEAAEDELVLCAPFAKAAVIERLLIDVGSEVRVDLFTRWRPEEIASGVSDTAVLAIVCARGGRVLLHNELHAKFFRSDSRVLLGSANLTGKALGWSRAPNLELLVPSTVGQIRALERFLRESSSVATQELADAADEAAAALPSVDLELEDLVEPASAPWAPQLRHPGDLFIAYAEGIQRLSRASAAAARVDLQFLDLPAGLEREVFCKLVAQRLGVYPPVKNLDEFLSTQRRFGEVRDMLQSSFSIDRDVADVSWQTLMRWLMEFMPERYVHTVNRHSEMFGKAEGAR